MVVIIVFFLCHWFLSLFFHSFFLHRYASHQLYTTHKNWERFFYFSTWLTQGSSFLVPRAYGVLHRMHHEYSDTEKDPHSPHFFKDIWQMMWHTAKVFTQIRTGEKQPEPQFTKEYLPKWDLLDRWGNTLLVRLVFMAAYTTIYIIFAPNYWWFLLLPIHFLMGPIQGAVVNWCGHKYGYSNYSNGDHSRNSTPWGVLLMGELFQNNHHYEKNSANFAMKWFEFDTTYLIMRVLNKVRIIKLIPLEIKNQQSR
ncbi:fatty acid desaturase [Filimonas effusa]|uniref:Acyl-CoA desaturase n=1 Tax=Filimonas effusa TaxID=2508721 RepID=A0A4Q1D5G0_9BACT|nr:fatty acid desaturase [Filimonas effusa]RXK83083.1 acyl-CoA desaturase [Filimonas effusa]